MALLLIFEFINQFKHEVIAIFCGFSDFLDQNPFFPQVGLDYSSPTWFSCLHLSWNFSQNLLCIFRGVTQKKQDLDYFSQDPTVEIFRFLGQKHVLCHHPFFFSHLPAC